MSPYKPELVSRFTFTSRAHALTEIWSASGSRKHGAPRLVESVAIGCNPPEVNTMSACFDTVRFLGCEKPVIKKVSRKIGSGETGGISTNLYRWSGQPVLEIWRKNPYSKIVIDSEGWCSSVIEHRAINPDWTYGSKIKNSFWSNRQIRAQFPFGMSFATEPQKESAANSAAVNNAIIAVLIVTISALYSRTNLTARSTELCSRLSSFSFLPAR